MSSIYFATELCPSTCLHGFTCDGTQELALGSCASSPLPHRELASVGQANGYIPFTQQVETETPGSFLDFSVHKTYRREPHLCGESGSREFFPPSRITPGLTQYNCSAIALRQVQESTSLLNVKRMYGIMIWNRWPLKGDKLNFWRNRSVNGYLARMAGQNLCIPPPPLLPQVVWWLACWATNKQTYFQISTPP